MAMETKAKRCNAYWAVVLAAAIWGVVGAWPAAAYAQKPATGTLATSPAEPDIASIDGQRGALDRFLDAHPEIANDVANYPGAMTRPEFLREHPEAQAFLEAHPLVKADPRAFVSPRIPRDEPRRSDLSEFMNNLAPLLAFACALLAILWGIRTLIENRRWNRSFKMHEDLHTKLIEKFASGQDFNAYLQSEGGRRLLEWTPPSTDTAPRGLPNPLSRIFWSLQVGLVLLLVGLGLLPLRGHMGAEDASALLLFGTLGVTLGAGFILSALLSYGLSKHLGLIGRTAQENEALARR